MEQDTKRCPYCAESIHIDAIKCRYCGEILDPDLRAAGDQELSTASGNRQAERKWIPGVAAVLSLFIPGAGQMYKGHIGRGLFWLIITVIGYCCLIIPGLILHVLCIVTAASGDPYK